MGYQINSINDKTQSQEQTTLDGYLNHGKLKLNYQIVSWLFAKSLLGK